MNDFDPALAALRESAVEVEADDQRFERRIVRRASIQRGSDSWRYWSPLMVGAAVGLLAMLAALQLVKAPVGPSPMSPVGEARNESRVPSFPNTP